MASKMQKINLSNHYYTRVTEKIKLQLICFPERKESILKHEKIALKKSLNIKEQLFHQKNIAFIEAF